MKIKLLKDIEVLGAVVLKEGQIVEAHKTKGYMNEMGYWIGEKSKLFVFKGEAEEC